MKSIEPFNTDLHPCVRSVPYMTGQERGAERPFCLFLDVSFSHRFIPVVHHTHDAFIPRFV